MKTLLITFKIFLLFTLLTGIIYPLVITLLAQVFFPYEANGSIMINDNKKVGSALIGQSFDSVIYFSSRPSSVSYNPLPSGGTNLGPSSAKLKDMVNKRKNQFVAFNKLDSLTTIPSEMLFASASGLDPHISVSAALLQVDRVVAARKFNSTQRARLEQLINYQTEKPQFLCFGAERINVLLLNLGIDKIQ
jgi:potassium-transporting ATPase KdpC subunit